MCRKLKIWKRVRHSILVFNKSKDGQLVKRPQGKRILINHWFMLSEGVSFPFFLWRLGAKSAPFFSISGIRVGDRMTGEHCMLLIRVCVHCSAESAWINNHRCKIRRISLFTCILNTLLTGSKSFTVGTTGIFSRILAPGPLAAYECTWRYPKL